MNKRKHSVKLMLAVIGLIGLIAPSSAHAYLDPGTGSYILQIVIAAFVGVAYSIKLFWNNICNFTLSLFGSKKKNDKVND